MRILSVFLPALLPLVALADVVVPIDKVENSVNIRLEMDATSDVVGKLRQGESLPLVSSEPGWHEVQLEGDATGYVSADWSEVQAEAAAVDDIVVEEEIAEEVAVEVAAEEPVEEVIEEVVEEVIEEDVEEDVDEVIEKLVEEDVEVEDVEEPAPAVVATAVAGPPGPPGPPGPQGTPGSPGAANIKGSENFLVRFKKETEGGNSQIFDDGNQVGIGTTAPKQRLEVNGSIQIHEQNSSVAGLMITQSSGDTGYIMHNRASTLTIGAGSQDRITIDRDGNVGIGVARPEHPLQMASGAHATSGGVWTNSSSRQLKENISDLTAEDATAALMQLQPVLFNYRNESAEEYVGFIAEDVPALVASNGRQSLSAMDIVAVLTKVVQQQQQKIEELEARLK